MHRCPVPRRLAMPPDTRVKRTRSSLWARRSPDARGRWSRRRTFFLGVALSIAVVGTFFTLAWLLNDAAEYAWIGRLLLGLFTVLNPLLVLFDRMVLRSFPAPSPAGRLAMQIAFVAAFLGWWWLVAVVVDRAGTRRRTRRGGA